jgi:hypothetical protein
MTIRATIIGKRCVDEAIVVTAHWGERPRLTFAVDHDKVVREVASVVVTREGSAAMGDCAARRCSEGAHRLRASK